MNNIVFVNIFLCQYMEYVVNIWMNIITKPSSYKLVCGRMDLGFAGWISGSNYFQSWRGFATRCSFGRCGGAQVRVLFAASPGRWFFTTVTHCEVRGSFGNLGTVAMLGLLTSAFSPAFSALSSHELLQAASSWMSMSSCTEMAPGLQSSHDSANSEVIPGQMWTLAVSSWLFQVCLWFPAEVALQVGDADGVVSFGQCPVARPAQEGPFRSGWLRDQPHPRGRGSIGDPLASQKCFLLVAYYFPTKATDGDDDDDHHHHHQPLITINNH